MRTIAILGVLAAIALAAWLRLHGVEIQVVQDDEWHAIHKLLSSSYWDIFRSFGYSDHSIPLTLFYKAMAGAVGLDEFDMRIVQVACGIALVVACAALAWNTTRHAPTTILLAFLVAGGPFLVLYSRFARPYAIVTLLLVLALGALWQWRQKRSQGLAAVACVLAALAAWLHPLSALFPMAALVFILVEDLQAPREWRARHIRSTLLLGVAAGLAMALPLVAPVINDLNSLSAKAGHSVPSAYTLFRMLSIFAGGLPDVATAIVAIVAVYGAWQFVRDEGDLGSYLVFVALAPILAVMFLGASWTHQGHTFARYVFPVQLVFLFWFSYGIFAALHRLIDHGALDLILAFGLTGAYLAFNPAIEQVRTLGPWYGHLYHHFDYVDEHNRAKRYYDGWVVPRFYQALGNVPRGNAPIIQAPFNFIAPYNPNAFYAQFHKQPELQGFVHNLCLDGPYYGEVPHDPRFRFRSFVYLDEKEAVSKTDARYLVFQREQRNGRPFKEADRCIAALRERYGEPMESDDRIVVFDLHPLPLPPKLQ